MVLAAIFHTCFRPGSLLTPTSIVVLRFVQKHQSSKAMKTVTLDLLRKTFEAPTICRTLVAITTLLLGR